MFIINAMIIWRQIGTWGRIWVVRDVGIPLRYKEAGTKETLWPDFRTLSGCSALQDVQKERKCYSACEDLGCSKTFDRYQEIRCAKKIICGDLKYFF